LIRGIANARFAEGRRNADAATERSVFDFGMARYKGTLSEVREMSGQLLSTLFGENSGVIW